MAITYKVSDKSSRFLVPTGESDIDVTKMAWTKTPMSGRRDIPCAYLTEYQQNVGQLISSAIYYTKAGVNIINGKDGFITASDPREVYKYRYFAEPTNFTYKIPFFSQKKVSVVNQFGFDNEQNPFASLLGLKNKLGASTRFAKLDAGVEAARAIASAILPGKIDLENPQSWEGSEPPSISLTFDLFNTGTVEETINNRNLAYILWYQNRPSRRSAFVIDPPVIYDLNIPDVTSMPVCYVQNLEILNLGNTRQLRVGKRELIIPEAYRFNITFKSLLLETRIILDGMDNGLPVKSVANGAILNQIAQDVANGSFDPGNPNFNNAVSNSYKIDEEFNFEPGTILEIVESTGGFAPGYLTDQ